MMAWIKTISPPEASGELQDVLDAAGKKAIPGLNIFTLQGLNPVILKASLDLYEAIMSGPSTLSREERAMIAIVVSKMLGCPYLTETHGEQLRSITRDDRLVRLIKIDYRMLLLDDRVRSMLDYAARITKDAHSITPETLQQLRADGLSDEDILNTAEVTGFFNYLARLAEALGMEQEIEVANQSAAKMPSTSRNREEQKL